MDAVCLIPNLLASGRSCRGHIRGREHIIMSNYITNYIDQIKHPGTGMVALGSQRHRGANALETPTPAGRHDRFCFKNESILSILPETNLSSSPATAEELSFSKCTFSCSPLHCTLPCWLADMNAKRHPKYRDRHFSSRLVFMTERTLQSTLRQVL